MNYKSLLVLMLSILAFSSCGETLAPSLIDQEEKEKETEELAEGVVSLTPGLNWRDGIEVFEFAPEEASKWNYDREGYIILSAEEASKIEGMKSGDVMISGDLFILFVDTIKAMDTGETEVKVRPFILAEAIHGDFNIPIFPEELIAEPDITNLAPGQYKYNILGDDWKPLIDELTLELIGANYFAFPITTTGGFEGKIPAVNGSYNCKGSTLARYCVDYLKIQVNFDFKAALNTKLSYSRKIGFKTDIDDIDLDYINSVIPPFTVGPLALRGYFYFAREMSVGVSAEGWVSFKATMDASLPIGFEYFNNGYCRNSTSNRGCGGTVQEGFNVIPNPRITPSFNKTFEVDAGGSAEGAFHQHVGLGFGFKVTTLASSDVGVKGISYETRLNQDLKINPFLDNKCLDSYFSLSGNVSADLKFFANTWVKDWEWAFLPESYDKKIFEHKFAEASSDALCVDPSNAKRVRLTLVKDTPIGLKDGEGFELDGVLIGRTDRNGNESFIEPTSASGGSNASRALKSDAKSCSEFLSKVALVNGSPIIINFDQGFKPNDRLYILQNHGGATNIGGAMGQCRGSSSVKAELHNGTAWKTINEEMSGNSYNAISGSLLVE